MRFLTPPPPTLSLSSHTHTGTDNTLTYYVHTHTHRIPWFLSAKDPNGQRPPLYYRGGWLLTSPDETFGYQRVEPLEPFNPDHSDVGSQHAMSMGLGTHIQVLRDVHFEEHEHVRVHMYLTFLLILHGNSTLFDLHREIIIIT